MRRFTFLVILAGCTASNGDSSKLGSDAAGTQDGVAGDTLDNDTGSTADGGEDVPPLADDTHSEADTAAPPDAGGQDTESEKPDVAWPKAPDNLGGERPAAYTLPDNYSHEKSWPIIVLLHGYSASGLIQDAYLGISNRATEDGFILVIPDGTTNSENQQFWNATDACCDFEGTGIDDVGYVLGLIDEAATYFNVDAKRVYLMGHSNGGFLSYRIACEAGDRITALVSLAGATWLNDAKCGGTTPVSVLQVHGTDDETIDYKGDGKYPSAMTTALTWVARNGCAKESVAGDPLDLVIKLPGNDTDTEAWGECEAGTAVELWTIQAGTHIPFFTEEFAPKALAFLLGKTK